MRVTINDAELEVDVQGEPGAPVLIVHHGGPGMGDRSDYTTAFAPFADRFRVITFDARGSGASSEVEPYSHEQWAADVDALREWAGAEKIVMAGHSYGGFMAQEYVTRYPDRVSAVILIDTAAADTFRATARKRAVESDRVNIDMEMFDRMFAGQIKDNEEFDRGWRAIAPLYTATDDPEVIDQIANLVSAYHYKTHNYAFGVNLPAYDVRPLLGSVSCPVLINVGRHDWITPVEASEEMAALIPGAELVIFENSGHSPLHEEKELWESTVRTFLDRVVPVEG
jgi:proline iminopeptidase